MLCVASSEPGMISFFQAVVYLSSYLFIVFTAISYACGLFYIAETVVGLHVLLFIFERFPLWTIVPGIVCHGIYYTLLRRFPDVKVLSLEFIGSMVALVLNHVVWWHFYVDRYEYSMANIAAFFLLFVWVVPLAFFVSLVLEDHALPSTHTAHSEHDPQGKDKNSKSRAGRLRVSVLSLCSCCRKGGSAAGQPLAPDRHAQTHAQDTYSQFGASRGSSGGWPAHSEQQAHDAQAPQSQFGNGFGFGAQPYRPLASPSRASFGATSRFSPSSAAQSPHAAQTQAQPLPGQFSSWDDHR